MVKKDYIILLIFLIIISLFPLSVKNDYYLGVLIFTSFNCIACIGLSLLMGYAGQISLGQAAFVSIGAYASGILTVKAGWSPWPSIISGIGIAGAVAFVVGTPTLRLKGHYLAMATLGFGSIVHIIAVASVGLTGGPEGLSNIPKLNIFGLILDNDIKYYYFSWFVTGICLFLSLNLMHSRTGRGFRAIHGSDNAASSMGINISAYKIQIFVLSAVYSSISGSLYAHYVNYVDPVPFGVMHSILLLTMVAVGGMHNIWGAITGAILLSILPEFLSFTSGYFKVIGVEYNTDYDTLIYGGILLSIMLFLPEGLFNGIKSIFTKLRKA